MVVIEYTGIIFQSLNNEALDEFQRFGGGGLFFKNVLDNFYYINMSM